MAKALAKAFQKGLLEALTGPYNALVSLTRPLGPYKALECLMTKPSPCPSPGPPGTPSNHLEKSSALIKAFWPCFTFQNIL